MKSRLTRLLTIYTTVFLVVLFGIVVGIRPESVGSDTDAYVRFFYMIINSEESRISEPLFISLANFISFFSENHASFLTSISIISFSSLLYFYYVSMGLNANKKQISYFVFFTLALILTLVSPFFINTQVNVLRSGLSIPFVLLAGYFFYLRHNSKFIIFSVIGLFFHYSSILYVLSILVFLRFKPKSLFIVFILSACIYSLGIVEPFVFNVLSSLGFDFLDYYLRYITMEGGYEKGVRFDLLLFTVFFATVSLYLYSKVKDQLSEFILLMYLSLCMPFLVLGFISYSDRLLLPAWFLIPAVISMFISYKFKISANGYYFLFTSVPLSFLVSIIFYGVI